MLNGLKTKLVAWIYHLTKYNIDLSTLDNGFLTTDDKYDDLSKLITTQNLITDLKLLSDENKKKWIKILDKLIK